MKKNEFSKNVDLKVLNSISELNSISKKSEKISLLFFGKNNIK